MRGRMGVGMGGFVVRGSLSLIAAVLSTLVPSTALGSVVSIDSTTITGLSCPTTNLCAAVDSVGTILTSTNPPAGAGAWSLARVRHVRFPNGYEGVSCPSANLCVAVDGDGDVTSSTNPTGGVGSWAVSHVPGSAEGLFKAVSCPSTSFCVAVDAFGNVITSTNPTGGGSAWTVTPIGAGGEADIACPSTALCVATTGGDRLFTSTDPMGGSAAWHQATLVGNPSLTSISCPTTLLCVAGARGATGSVEGVYTSTNPTGGAGSWTETSLGTSVNALACPSTGLCVAAAGHQILTSTNPTGGAGAWTAAVIDPTQSLASVSCPSTSLCVAGDTGGNVIASADPTGGPGAWSLFHVDDSVGEDESAEGGSESPAGSSASTGGGGIAVAGGGAAGVRSPSAPPSHGGVATASGLVKAAGRTALLILHCPAAGACSGVVKLIAEVTSGPVAKRHGKRHPARRDRRTKRKRRVVIGKHAFSIAPGHTATVKVPLNAKGKAMLRHAGKRGLKVRLTGTGIKGRTVYLKPGRHTSRGHRRHGKKSKARRLKLPTDLKDS
jgi:hypothetical protein